MARTHNNFKPRRSRRSGLKKAKLVKKNNDVLHNIWTHLNAQQLKAFITILLIGMFMSCANVRYVYVDPKDSVVRKQRVIYDDVYSPLFFDRYYWNQRPIIIYSKPQPRPGHGPLPPTPKPRK